MKKKKIALIFIFVLSFTIVSVLAVTQTTRAEAYSMNLPTCEYEYNSNYTGTSYFNTYTYYWEDIQPIKTSNEYSHWERFVSTELSIPVLSGIQMDAMCRIGPSPNDYKSDRKVMVSSLLNYTCTTLVYRISIFNEYTAHFVKTADSYVGEDDEDYASNEWEDFDAEQVDLGFKGRWIYD